MLYKKIEIKEKERLKARRLNKFKMKRVFIWFIKMTMLNLKILVKDKDATFVLK